MTHARRAATRAPWQHLRSALTKGGADGEPSRAATRAMEEQDEAAAAATSRRMVRILVPGVAAAVAVTGTAFAVAGASKDSQLQAVPAAASLPDRTTDRTDRSAERPSPAAQTPSASAMPTGTPSAAPSSASTSTKPQTLAGSAFTPKPTPTPTATPSKTAGATPTPTATATAAPSATASSTAKAASTAGRSSSPSTSASTKASGSVENCPAPSGWLAPNAQRVYEASCRNFPYVEAYGGQRIGDPGEHGTGHAVDIMISGDRGWDIANYMRANAAALGVTEVIYQQKIWTTQRSSEGWRSMSDRGSATANHMDHVHVTTS